MNTISNVSLPHPFPYQGSKRNIAKYILPYFPSNIHCLIEPFCGAAAISIAAAANGLTKRFILNDINAPLMNLWAEMLAAPMHLADNYEQLWLTQQKDPKEYFYYIRSQFNYTHQPEHLLYLLARIVKGAVRYSSDGVFNQSADNRRLGMKPNTMRKNIMGVSQLLAGKTTISSTDFIDSINLAAENDLIYMDPPYQGTSFTRDHRYYNGLTYDDFVDALTLLNQHNISYIISYDGITGEKTHGKPLPSTLSLQHLYIDAGRSTQSTLLGKNDNTIESLYLSPSLVDRLDRGSTNIGITSDAQQQELVFA